MIIGIVGERLAGKTTVAEYIRDKYGFSILGFSEDVLRPILIEKGKPLIRENYEALSIEIDRKYGGTAGLAKLLLRKAQPGKDYVITGVRTPAQARYIKSFQEGACNLSIEASPEIRFGRIRKRNDPKDASIRTLEDFMRTEKAKKEILIPKTMKLADFAIRNEGTLEDLRAGVDKLMARLLEKR